MLHLLAFATLFLLAATATATDHAITTTTADHAITTTTTDDHGPAPAPDFPMAERNLPPEPSPSAGPSPNDPALSPSETALLTAAPLSSVVASPLPVYHLAPSPIISPSDSEKDNQQSVSADDSNPLKWCVVRDEFADCQYAVSLLRPDEYTWACVRKQSAFECMRAIKNGEADVMTLDAGLAYIAFINFSMKAVLAEEYCSHSTSYEAVAVVTREMCEKNPKISLKNFKNLKSCHPGYLTASGWNYPLHFLIDSKLQQSLVGGEAVLSDFFSKTCAPSELEGRGLCTSCGNNGSCPMDSIYAGFAGAFRCLMDGTGDIAFLRSDTIQRLSADGSNKQEWSTKSVNEFMYLCPQGGCRPINDNLGSCSFGSIPANVVMTRNSQPNSRRIAIERTLLNASWTEALYSGKNWQDHLFSASAQNLVAVRELTRHYLGDSALMAQRVQNLDVEKPQTTDTSPFASGGSFSFVVSVSLFVFSMSISLQRHW